MMQKYGYLEEYVNNQVVIPGQNIFYKFDKKEIIEAEAALKIVFPEELKEFWEEIGYGFFKNSIQEKNISKRFFYSNRLLPPEDIVSILTEGTESGIITEEGLEYLEKGDIPFFEVADCTSYLVMKPSSANPNAVYDIDGTKIEDSIEQFIWKLYHVSPTYYLEKL